MQIESDTVKWMLGGIGGAIALSVSVVWGVFMRLFRQESECQRQLATMRGAMKVLAKYERRADVRTALREAAGLDEDEIEELAEAIGTGKRKPKE